MSMPEFFVLNDETVKNSHGFRLLNAGGELERFKDNPVMLDSHDMKLVIGRWSNLRIEGTKLIAAPEFDTEDPDGKRIAGKVDRGFMKAASLGIYIKDAKYVELADGEVELVVTKWEALEGSVLGVPSNRNALAFYAEDGVQLSIDQVLSTIQTLALPTKPKKDLTNNFDKMEKIILSAEAATALGIATEHENIAAVNAAIVKLSARAGVAEKALNDFNTERATTLVDLAVTEGRIEATRKESFVKMAIADFNQANDILAAMPAKNELGANVKTGEQGVNNKRADWDYMKWAKEDPKGLEELAAKSPDEFKKLKEGYKPQYS